METQRLPSKAFRGLNNVADPQRLERGWLTQADNVDVTDRNALVRCRGFTQRTTNFAITGAYATRDMTRLYVVDAGELRQMNTDLTYVVLRTGLSALKMYFEEVNGVVFYTNGVDYGIIEPAGARPWGVPVPSTPYLVLSTGNVDPGAYQAVCTFVDDRGMEGGNSPVSMLIVPQGGAITITNIEQRAGYTTNVYLTMANGTVFYQVGSDVRGSMTWNGGALGMELPFWNLDGPRGLIPALFQGQMYVAEPAIELDQTVIWRSEPLHFHHFDYSAEALAVPGMVRMMRAAGDTLVIGTDRVIVAWDGDKLTQLANYGVVPGWHDSVVGGQLYFWSLRGACRAMPFVNLTEGSVSVAPGLSAGATVLEQDGQRRYVVALQRGGEAYNRRIT